MVNNPLQLGNQAPKHCNVLQTSDEDPTFFSTDPDPAGEKMRIRIRLEEKADPDPTLNRNEDKKIFIF